MKTIKNYTRSYEEEIEDLEGDVNELEEEIKSFEEKMTNMNLILDKLENCSKLRNFKLLYNSRDKRWEAFDSKILIASNTKLRELLECL